MRRREPTRRTATPCLCAHCGRAAALVPTLVRDLSVCGGCWVRWCLGGAETTPAPLAADAAARELVDVVPPPAELLVIGGAHV